jgi:UDP-3-O-[3-hydroxymyristoyl] N-acetylglucosamine deacetylase
MQTTFQQRTLAKSVDIQGTGFWGGHPVNVRLRPAEANTGITFCRVDMPGSPKINVCVDAVQPTQFRTRLTHGSAAVDMTEHLLAALYAAGIDNCRVDCDAQELPSLDGSAAGYLRAIHAAGTNVQASPVRFHSIQHTIRLGDDKHWIIAAPSTDNRLTLEYRLDYGIGSVIEPCSFHTTLSPSVFAEQIAEARTFVTQYEATHIRSLGLAEHVTYQDLLVFGDKGPIENELRYANECARHKLLDLVGDLALSGLRIAGRIIASRSGHALNAKLASAIVEQHQHSKLLLVAA